MIPSSLFGAHDSNWIQRRHNGYVFSVTFGVALGVKNRSTRHVEVQRGQTSEWQEPGWNRVALFPGFF